MLRQLRRRTSANSSMQCSIVWKRGMQTRAVGRARGAVGSLVQLQGLRMVSQAVREGVMVVATGRGSRRGQEAILG